MKKSLFLLAAVVFLLATDVFAQSDREGIKLVFGGINNGVLGTGKAGDRFSRGFGFFGELEFDFNEFEIVFGINTYSTKNTIYSHSTDVTIWVPIYCDIRVYFLNREKFRMFATGGCGYHIAKFDGFEGYVTDAMLSFGFGAKIYIGNKVFLQPLFKPYFLTTPGDNMGLRPSFGIEGSLGIGF